MNNPMENENQNPEVNPEQEENESRAQPDWFQDFVEHYDVDKPQRGEMLKGVIQDIQESSILLDVGFKRDAIIPAHDLDQVDGEIREQLSVGDEIFVSVIRTPEGSDDLLVSLQRGLAHKTWQKAEELAEQDQAIDLEVVDQNRGGLLVAFENIRGFIPNSHIPSIRKGTTTQKAGEIKSEMIGKILPLKVIEINAKERRLVFSARAAQSDQRQKRIHEIEMGTVLKSRVVNVVDFGVFVDLEGVDGLVHKSELDWERVPHPSALFQVGDEIEVKVVGVDKEKERVSLSRKALLPNPWLKNAEEYQVGDLVEGVVVNVLDFGAFVELQERLHGLVHVSEIGYANAENPKAVVKKGDPVLVKVLSIDPERERISLSMRRVPLSEQMEWIMNLEEVSEGALLDGEVEDGISEYTDAVSDEEPVQQEVDVDPEDQVETSGEDSAADEEPAEESKDVKDDGLSDSDAEMNGSDLA